MFTLRFVLNFIGWPILALALGAAAEAAPIVAASPQSVTVTAGAAATFTVAATGTPPLHFDWKRDGASLGAADLASYTTPAAALADSGAAFSVTVSDSTGNTPSAPAYLTVNPAAPRVFTVWAAAIADAAKRGPLDAPWGDGVPNLLKYTLGVAASQRATAVDLPRLISKAGGTVFRFDRDRAATGVTVAAEKSTTLAAGAWASVTAAKVADDGATEVWEAPVSGADARAFYRLSVTTNPDTAPVIGTPPAAAAVNPGGTTTFTVAATGTGPFTYQWRKNGAAIAGATGASYTPPPVTAADNGARYSVLITGPAGTVASAEAVLTVVGAVTVADLVAQVSEARYTVNLRDRLYTHLGDNRGTVAGGGPSPQHELVRTMLKNHFAACGLTVTEQEVNSPNFHNIIGEKRGTTRPDDIIIVGGHYDSVGNPGANDNASGTAAIMEAAQVLGSQSFEATLRFIAFDLEEAGLVGSRAYAPAHSGEHIVYMLNVDTIGQDAGAHKLSIDSPAAGAMKTLVASAMTRYSGGITSVVRQTGDQSDHLAFHDAGFTACEVYNDDWWTQGDPHNHQPSDSVDTAGYINYAFATMVTRGVVGFLAEQAVLISVPTAPVLGAHTLRTEDQYQGHDPVTTAAVTTQATGSVLLAVSLQDNVNSSSPTDNYNNPWTPLGPKHNYTGASAPWYHAMWAAPSAAGGPGHTLTVAKPGFPGSEASLEFIEIKNATRIKEYVYAWTEDTAAPTTPSITTTGPAVLIAVWAGGSWSLNHTAVPNNGFTVIDSYLILGANSGIQVAIAMKQVAQAGTYSTTWAVTPTQGSGCFLVAIE